MRSQGGGTLVPQLWRTLSQPARPAGSAQRQKIYVMRRMKKLPGHRVRRAAAALSVIVMTSRGRGKSAACRLDSVGERFQARDIDVVDNWNGDGECGRMWSKSNCPTEMA